MVDETSQTRFFPKNANQRRVPGLRDAAPPSDVKVFRLNPDGTKGELLRVEPATYDNKKRYGDGF